MNKAGDIAELAFILEATKRNWTPFLPFSHATRVDVVLHKNGQPPVTVQVKKAVLQKRKQPHHNRSWKVVVGSCKSSRLCNPQKERRIKQYKAGDFDVFALYIQELDLFSFHRLSDVAGRSTMRFNESKTVRDNWEIFDEF